ncbi:MAG: phage adsorption protein NrfB [Bdellovibrionaceae bacterium]|nr:phage adsorption protein NrfB [Pseudobdellovibrionaceae bacterium]
MTFEPILSDFNGLFAALAILVVYAGLLMAADDLWIDVYFFTTRLSPRRLTKEDKKRLRLLPQKRIGIMIANWHEEDVLEQMISGNVASVDYLNYTFFLGVYPNDDKTLAIARQLEARYREVKVIVNSRPGPTTKGQMLNEVARGILAYESEQNLKYDLFLMHDSEDVLHPLSLSLINDAAETHDFVQIPIFSFDVKPSKLVGGTYLDEFSESHTKDLLVREHMGAAIPSAGVGTALSRNFVLSNMSRQNSDLLREDTLTEDYDLGLNAKANGFKSTFACAYDVDPEGRWDFIATREFFPDRLSTAVRQKTRWTLGIVFQGRKNLGWSGDWVDKYFLFRDRRGPINAFLIVLNALVFISFLASSLFTREMPEFLSSALFVVPATLNFVNMIYRAFRRAKAVRRVNGWTHALLVPLRWPVGNFVNTLAVAKAVQSHLRTLRTGLAPKWDKTAHVMPEGFGRPTAIPAVARVRPGPAPERTPDPRDIEVNR